MNISRNDNRSEYANPERYDAENRWATDDDFFLELAQRIGGPVLDIACGTGRLTRAIAGAGIDVTGVDIDSGMLARARKLTGDREIEWILDDCRTMDLGRTFRLALMTSHGFQHLLTDEDQRAFLERTQAHLVAGGYLAFETRNPEALTTPAEFGEEQYWRCFQLDDGCWVDVSNRARYDPDRQIEEFQMTRTVRSTGEQAQSRIELRFTRVDDLNRLLEEYGFQAREQFGYWDKRPVTADAHEIITVAQKVG